MKDQVKLGSDFHLVVTFTFVQPYLISSAKSLFKFEVVMATSNDEFQKWTRSAMHFEQEHCTTQINFAQTTFV
jgi:hypothetical protein